MKTIKNNFFIPEIKEIALNKNFNKIKTEQNKLISKKDLEIKITEFIVYLEKKYTFNEELGKNQKRELKAIIKTLNFVVEDILKDF